MAMNTNNRRASLGYWLVRIGLNGVAIGVFWAALHLIGAQFSWWLYWSAFTVYIVLSLGDTVIDNLWPSRTASPDSRSRY